MKAAQGCWTCKGRKIGCDRTIPYCQNCVRTKRECHGYGTRLVWPGQPNRRRRDCDLLTHEPPSQSRVLPHYGIYFLNLTPQDVAKARGSVPSRMLITRAQPMRSLSLHAPILEKDGMLFSYYINIISSMISTTQNQNGFSCELIPMALSRRDASASALYNAMLAVSAIHHLSSQDAALPFKARAIKHLMYSVATEGCWNSEDITLTQLAASMMLCVYNVFDKEEGHWHIHLNGAKQTLQKLCMDHKQHLATNFTVTWFLYHDVLASFTQPSRLNSDYSSLLWDMMVEKSNNSIIIGSLGCSLQLLSTINQINKIRLLRTTSPNTETKIMSPELVTRTQNRRELEMELLEMTQNLDSAENTADDSEKGRRIIATAEFYRLAALLYLLRVCPSDDDHIARNRYLQDALSILGTLEVATSPWPLFVVSCEVRSDDDRITILRTLDQMDAIRHIGNLQALREIIVLFWKQDDLRTTSGSSSQIDWLDFVDCEVPVPWFV